MLDLLAPSPHGSGSLSFYEGASLTWHELWAHAEQCSGGIASHTAPGDRVAMLMEPTHECAAAFVGAFLAGCDVVSLPTRPRGMVKEQYFSRLHRLLEVAEVRAVYGGDQLEQVEPAVGQRILRRFGDLASTPRLRDGHPTLIQFSSGTTGEPKSILMPLDRLGANINASISIIGDTAGTPGVSWLPWSHDFGLVGSFLSTWAVAERSGRDTHIIPTEKFIRNPAAWMHLADQLHAGTTMTPAFALRFAEMGFRQGMDLSGFINIWIGGERVDPNDLRGFAEAARPYGLDSTTLSPAYGMAENGVSVTAVRPDEHYVTRWIRLDWDKGIYLAAEPDAPGAFEIVGCGRPVGDVELSIDPLTGVSTAGSFGHINITSSSLFAGYAGSSETVDGSFQTGDLGALIDGELYVFGRADDVVVVQGQNFVVTDLERTVAQVRPGTVAVCADSQLGGYVVVCEGKVADADWGEIIAALAQEWGTRPSRVGTVPPGGLPRTTSSKLRRHLVMDAVEATGAWR